MITRAIPTVPEAERIVAREPIAMHAGATEPTMPQPRDTARMNVDARDHRAALGKLIFFDPRFSEPAGMSCAGCHDPKHAFAGNNGSTIGVAQGSRPGHFARRNTPSLLYLKYIRKFHFRWEEDAPIPDAVGGFFWDGRADSIAQLVRQPLLNPDEMGNRDAQQIAAKLHAAPYADELGREYALRWDDSEAALNALGGALEAFLTSDDMSPFTSKYDDYVRGKRALSEQQARGLALFRDRSKGACDACHKLNSASPNPERSLFTDYGFEALAVPRNRKLPQNKDPKRYDLGLCEPDARHFPMARELWCGNFRTPSLRNVAVRSHYMHNGAFTSLRDVVEFYATRGVTPRRWYKSDVPFDDVPAQYRQQVGIERVPYDRHVGQTARLDAGEVDAIVAFLKTLTDAAYE